MLTIEMLSIDEHDDDEEEEDDDDDDDDGDYWLLLITIILYVHPFLIAKVAYGILQVRARRRDHTLKIILKVFFLSIFSTRLSMKFLCHNPFILWSLDPTNFLNTIFHSGRSSSSQLFKASKTKGCGCGSTILVPVTYVS